METIDLFLIVPSSKSFWPINSTNIVLKKLMGREILLHIVDFVNKIFQIKKLIVLYKGNDAVGQQLKKILQSSPYEISIVKIDSDSPEDLKEVVQNSTISQKVLISYALNKNLLELDFLKKLRQEKRILINSSGNTKSLFYYGPVNSINSSTVIVQSKMELLTFPWELYNFFQKVLNIKVTGKRISGNVELKQGSKIIGPCVIGENVIVFENAVIKGPCYIGPNTIIGNNAVIRQSIIEEGSLIGANMEVARSWLGEHTETHSGYIGDSIFDNHVHTGAGFITANVRLDRKTVKVRWLGKKIDTRLPKLGAIIGSNTEIGIHSGTMPGVLIGHNVLIGPGTIVFENVDDNTIVYAKQSLVVKSRKI